MSEQDGTEFPIGAKVRIHDYSPEWDGLVVTVLGYKGAFVRTTVPEIVSAASFNDIILYPRELVLVDENTRVQDAPSEEVQINTLKSTVADLEREAKASDAKIAALTRQLESANKRAEESQGIMQASSYPFRVQIGSRGNVVVKYYETKMYAEDFIGNQSGYRTIEKRENGAWVTVHTAWH